MRIPRKGENGVEVVLSVRVHLLDYADLFFVDLSFSQFIFFKFSSYLCLNSSWPSSLMGRENEDS